MTAAYVRDTYGIDFKVGDRLVVAGRAGTLVSFPDQYLGVRFDGDKHASRCHPTWEVSRESAAPTGPRPDLLGALDQATATVREAWKENTDG